MKVLTGNVRFVQKRVSFYPQRVFFPTRQLQPASTSASTPQTVKDCPTTIKAKQHIKQTQTDQFL